MGSILEPLQTVVSLTNRAVAQQDPSADLFCKISQLLDLFPQQVFLESDHERYSAVQNSYWSGTQKDLRPACFFQPDNGSEVATAVQICAQAKIPFGVKSGGHGHYAGQSCLDGGVQFDLCRLNSIEISPDRSTVSVGPGCTWRKVYTTLEPQGLMAVGGRSADVGVGGFLIGGKSCSFLSL